MEQKPLFYKKKIKKILFSAKREKNKIEKE